jgi:hypothetical protein
MQIAVVASHRNGCVRLCCAYEPDWGNCALRIPVGPAGGSELPPAHFLKRRASCTSPRWPCGYPEQGRATPLLPSPFVEIPVRYGHFVVPTSFAFAEEAEEQHATSEEGGERHLQIPSQWGHQGAVRHWCCWHRLPVAEEAVLLTNRHQARRPPTRTTSQLPKCAVPRAALALENDITACSDDTAAGDIQPPIHSWRRRSALALGARRHCTNTDRMDANLLHGNACARPLECRRQAVACGPRTWQPNPALGPARERRPCAARQAPAPARHCRLRR